MPANPFLLDCAIMYVLGVAGYSGSGKTTLLENSSRSCARLAWMSP
jgi:uridine kinase